MSSRGRLSVGIAVALIAGVAAGELLTRSATVRDFLGRLTGRGGLVTLANGRGIYESDLPNADPARAGDLIVARNLERVAADEIIAPEKVDREIALLAAQFGDENAFRNALQASRLSNQSLRERVKIDLQGLSWLEKHVRPNEAATEAECRRFYEGHGEMFTQPVRYRAAHLFLAAPPETPQDTVEEKKSTIAAIATRIEQGETVAQLAGEVSEDENTKTRSGDLGYFAERGVPAEFIAEVRKLHVGETSKPFRSPLGFHIAQLTDLKEARALSFEEARPEISRFLANERRAARIEELSRQLAQPN